MLNYLTHFLAVGLVCFGIVSILQSIGVLTDFLLFRGPNLDFVGLLSGFRGFILALIRRLICREVLSMHPCSFVFFEPFHHKISIAIHLMGFLIY